MATKPTLANAAFATDANFSSGPASGTPTKVAPTGIAAQGWRPGDALGYVGAWFNYMMNQAYLWFTYLGDLHNSADFLNKSYTWLTGMHRFTGGLRSAGIGLESGDLTYTDSAGAAVPVARSMRIALQPVPVNTSAGAVLVQWYAVAGVLSNASISAGDCAVFAQLPRGIVITGVDFVVSGVAIQTVTCQFWKNTTQIGTDRVSSGAGVQTLSLTGLSETVAVAQNYWFKFTATSAAFQIQEIVVNYNDPGFKGN